MHITRLCKPSALIALVSAAAIGSALPAFGAATPMNVRGTIVSLSATSITVQTAMGTRTLATSKATRITGILPSTRSAIKPGTFIGTANVSSANGWRALEVVVFPPALKGSGLGDYAWDLPAGGHTSSMTNGMVSAGHSSMTNGTVSGGRSAMTNGTISSASAATISVNYGKGTKTIAIPANVPVVTIVPGSPKLLMKGAHVFVRPQPSAPSDAALIAVGENGTVPPM